VTRFANIVAVARREYLVRVRTRSFVFGTVLLVAGVIAIAMVPVIIRAIDQPSSQRIAVWVGTDDIDANPALTLGALLNAPTGAEGAPATAGFEVRAVPELEPARRAVDAGEDSAVLGITRGGGGDLAFTLYTNESPTGRTSQLLRQAVSAVAIADRLARLGVTPGDQARIFAPADYTVAWADPDRTDPGRTNADEGAAYLLGFGMTILIFMMIILYGQWVAMSVVEEKTSRVMEVILNAATPFQLLAGKVVGVGAVALTQYAAVIVAGVLALLAQGPIARVMLGGSGEAMSLPPGLTVSMLGLLGVYGILGFALYAVLYAAAGSLVSRQEDVSQAVMPMALISTAGYLVGAYASTGLLDIRSDWVAILSQVPFFSPFIMLSRVTAAGVQPWEILLSVVLLAVGIVVALWVAARIYAAGVLLYGQRPGLRALWRLMRTGV